ncbi:MAG: hypothetical protein FWC64_00795 [Treponema sp.]|nr:hypothetical protein [Treponema sp.]
MKRTTLCLFFLAGFIAIPAMAQYNFTTATPDYLSLGLSLPIGFHIGDERGGQLVANAPVPNLSVSFSVLPNFRVGYDYIAVEGQGDGAAPGISVQAHLLRMEFYLIRWLGFSFGLGWGGVDQLGQSSHMAAALSLGWFADFFQARAPSGFTYALGVRIDYLASLHTAEAVGQGSILFAIRFQVGR